MKRQEKNDRFEQFWKIYPRHEVKMKARLAFERINPDDKTLWIMLQWVEQAKYSIQWNDVQYIPHAATWLNRRQWEDDLPPMKHNPIDTIGAPSERPTKCPECGVRGGHTDDCWIGIEQKEGNQ
jgi:hypothetical protein